MAFDAEKPMKPKPPRAQGGAAGTDRVVARPDGYYWVADDGEQEFGPYETAAQAIAAASESIEVRLEEGQAVLDAEAEIGVADRQDRDIVEVDEQPPPAGEKG
jgi:hypothetical protein